MPLHDLGYRSWTGQRTPVTQRWWVIWETGVRLAWRSMWVRRMVFATWIPAIITAVLFFIYEQSLSEIELRQELADADILPMQFRAMMQNSQDSRHMVWTFFLYRLYRYSQGPMLVLLIGIIAPGLISRDLRSRAYLLYFSRPITVLEYLLGKVMTICSYMVFTITLPSLALYALGVLLSPTWTVAWDTFDLPLRVLASSLVFMVVTSVLALCFSSLTTETRYAGFAWFAMWLLGAVTYGILSSMDSAVLVQEQGQVIMSTYEQGGIPQPSAAILTAGARWEPFSVYHALGRVQSWIFGLETPETSQHVMLCALTLALVTTIAGVILVRRVQRPLHI